MSLHKAKILGIGVTLDSVEIILEYIKKYLDHPQEKQLIIVTPNPEQVVLAQRNDRFREIINRADVAIPDGVGLAFILGLKKISGVEFMESLVALAAKQGVSIGLIGGRDGVAVEALECLRKKYPGLNGWAEGGPELTIESGKLTVDHFVNNDEFFKKIIDLIKKNQTRMVFIGLGAPKQEYFIHLLQKELSTINYQLSIVLMSVGGSFDEISGRIPRSPKIIDRMGLKWLWRLILEPWRWRRQLALVEFVWLYFLGIRKKMI